MFRIQQITYSEHGEKDGMKRNVNKLYAGKRGMLWENVFMCTGKKRDVSGIQQITYSGHSEKDGNWKDV